MAITLTNLWLLVPLYEEPSRRGRLRYTGDRSLILSRGYAGTGRTVPSCFTICRLRNVLVGDLNIMQVYVCVYVHTRNVCSNNRMINVAQPAQPKPI